MRDTSSKPHRVYLDHAATTELLPAAQAAMLEAFAVVGNPNSIHAAGRRSREVLEDARESLAQSLGAHPTEIVWTSGGTESNNLAIYGGTHRRGRPRLVTTAVEHPAVLQAGLHAPISPQPHDIIPVSSTGHVELSSVAQRIGTDTGIVSVQWVNNEVGTIQPIAQVAELATSVGAWSHSDAAQAVGHIDVDFATSKLDLLSVAAHKVGGPVGIGALLVSRAVELTPLLHGGGQERKVRSGTQAIALAAGFAAAVAHAVQIRHTEYARLHSLRAMLVERTLGSIDDVSVNGTDPLSPAICNLTFHGLRAADLQFLLDRAGFDCSTGSACHAGVVQPSEVLQAMGRSTTEASASMRFSFGWSTNSDDISKLSTVLPDLVAQARAAFTASMGLR